MTATSTAPAVRTPSTPTRRRTAGRWFTELGWRHVVGVVFVVYAAFPIVYVLSASVAESGTLTGSNQLFDTFSTENYARLADTVYWSWFANSVLIAVATSIGTVLMGAAAAYAFSRFRFTGRRAGLTTLLILQMFPQMLAFVAIFLLLISLGEVVPALGLNSRVALICVYLGGALGVNTFLMYGFFNTVPRELDEAAKIDGATHAQTYWTIILRLVTPILAVVALLSIIATFGEFVIARVLLQSESNWTLAVGLYSWVSSLLEANWGLFAAGAVISTIPILALFLFLQKYIVGGLTAGSVKG
ncbi:MULTISPECIES: sugar ABC transporter permease [unclassified Isoptericola]|uniref:sugar ABC transporter permease n=1 Tax=unclassified Isoptericola TaxID=2623355 RepID=UPI00271314EB|nr:MULTISPECIES: sugar ABC transporter permease [unclassified Isoptericola]MDO8145313.1 sugar ABC transporter permease [Isoptericola sp. 178]MDO8148951.1 sugar ABC transporter permease [Isoptericola sp. b515]MDO8151106.1 sugar ABC transporter permease [Isoptericola sp. b408]